MRRLIKSIVASAVVAVLGFPIPARADGFVNPWAGVNFGSDIADGHGGFGVNAGAMGAGVIGGEVGFGYSPGFLGTQNGFGNNTVIDVMGNLMVDLPIGRINGAGFHPYVAAGLGLVRTQIDDGTPFDVAFSDNDFGWNAGGGAMLYFNDNVGVRADARYLRTINGNVLGSVDMENGDFHFWRAGFGLVIR